MNRLAIALLLCSTAAFGQAVNPGGGGGSTGTIPATSSVLKGDNAGNATSATPGTDYVIPSGTVANAATSTTAINLSAGVLGSVPTQSSPGVTTFVAPNITTSRQFLVETGTGTAGASPVFSALASGDIPLSVMTFAKQFAATQNHLWLLTEGTGNTAADYYGTANATSNGSFTWTGDGGLSFAGGYTNRGVATGATSYLTTEVVLVNGMPIGTQSMLPVAYGGQSTTGSGKAQTGILLNQQWQNTNTSQAVSLPSYTGYIVAYNGTATSYLGSSSVVAQGVHVVDFEGGAGQPWAVFIDGQPVADLYGGNSDLNPTSINGGYLEFGGSPLGVANCPTASCGFNGTIYGVATYSTRLTQAQIQQNVNNWKTNILTAKGVNLAQSAYVNSGNGAQGTAGKTVNLVGYGESITWGHGLSSPTTQNYSVVAAASINGGNANGFGFGFDSRTEYLMHKSISAMQAMYSPAAVNVAVLFSNANDCRASGTLPTNTYSSSIASQAARDTITDALTLQSLGWSVLIAPGNSGTPSIGTGDTAKDTCNPVLRQRSLSAGIPFWDIAADVRFGADGAYAGTTGTACGGSPCYQSDQLHPTQQGQAVIAANLAQRVNRLIYSAPTTATGTTYAMKGNEAPLTAAPASAALAITLPTCVGMTGETLQISNPQNTYAVTVVPISSAEPMNSFTSAQTLANFSTMTLKVVFNGDATAGCHWVY